MRNSLVVVRIYTEECIELSSVGLAPARPNYLCSATRYRRGKSQQKTSCVQYITILDGAFYIFAAWSKRKRSGPAKRACLN